MFKKELFVIVNADSQESAFFHLLNFWHGEALNNKTGEQMLGYAVDPDYINTSNVSEFELSEGEFEIRVLYWFTNDVDEILIQADTAGKITAIESFDCDVEISAFIIGE